MRVPLLAGGFVEVDPAHVHSLVPVTQKNIDGTADLETYTMHDFWHAPIVGCDIYLKSGGVVRSSLTKELILGLFSP